MNIFILLKTDDYRSDMDDDHDPWPILTLILSLR